MPANSKAVPKFFRGKWMVALLVGVGIAAFLVLGGHRKVLSFAVDEMADFLLGVNEVKDQDPAEDRGMADHAIAAEPSVGGLISGGGILGQVGATTVMAAPVEEPEADLEETEAAEEAPETPGPGIEAVDAQGTPAVVEIAARAEVAAGGEPIQDVQEADQILLTQAAADPPATGQSPDQCSAPTRDVIRTYTASFLRDPFHSLVTKGEGRSSKLLEVAGARMVGSVWGESGIIALLEDEANRSYALTVGDRVINGHVVSVTPASVTFSITVFGLTRTVTLELAEEGEW
jgi:hypothetical protein